MALSPESCMLHMDERYARVRGHVKLSLITLLSNSDEKYTP